jgi:hypothetical protein
MRRLFRVLFYATTVLSLLLCLGMSGLWVRSYWVADRYCNGAGAFAVSTGGMLSVLGRPSSLPAGTPALSGTLSPRGYRSLQPTRLAPRRASASQPGYQSSFDFVGVSWFLTYGGKVGRGYLTPFFQATAPHWIGVALFGVLPGIFLLRRLPRWVRGLRRRGLDAGCCGSCGYDLRATPSRCPECGMVPAAITQAW